MCHHEFAKRRRLVESLHEGEEPLDAEPEPETEAEPDGSESEPGSERPAVAPSDD